MRAQKFKYNSVKTGKKLIHVSERFEYFYHYWLILTSRHSKIFYDTNKFESHRSLLSKTINSVKFDFSKSEPKFNRFFKRHPYFESDNIIIKDLSVLKLIVETKSIDYSSNQNKIIENIERIIKYFDTRINYPKKISNLLAHIISRERKLEDLEKGYIRMLTNAIILELYDNGFSIEYIKKIPKIITFQDSINEYPYKKNLEDFDYDKEQYGIYKKKHKHNLGVFIAGITNLIQKKKFKGYICFKVFNFNFKRENSIKIGKCKFYNPQLDPNYIIGESDQDFGEIETFYDPGQQYRSNFNERSKCNVITEVSLNYPLRNLETRNEIEKAVSEAKCSLSFMLNQFHIRENDSIKIEKEYFFLFNPEFTPIYYSLNIFSTPSEKSLELDETTDKFYMYRIGLYNKLDCSIKLHWNIKQIIDFHVKIELNSKLFRFSELYSLWESVLEENQMKSLFKNSLLKTMRINFMGDIIQLLKFFFWSPFSSKNGLKYNKFLSEHGVEVQAFKKIETKRFLKNYRQFFIELDFAFFNEIEIIIQKYLNHFDNYTIDVKRWIRNTIEEVYIERNCEVHDNISNRFTHLKLKEDFLYLSKLSVFLMVENMNIRNRNSVRDILKRIKSSV